MKHKFFKAVCVFLTVAFFVCAFCSCSKDTVTAPSLDEDGNYTGFSSVSSDYTAEQAKKDGVLVLTDNKPTGDTKPWDSFLAKSQKGKNAFVRVASYSGKNVEFDDLYFTDGKYRLFKRDKSGEVTDKGEYSYLVNAEESGLNAYILTDTPDVNAMQAIIQSYLSGKENKKADYVLLGFTLHLG
ncbi:MAG: hypothetical protein ACI4XE_10180 [Acutalibacteraceae bacterium]